MNIAERRRRDNAHTKMTASMDLVLKYSYTLYDVDPNAFMKLIDIFMQNLVMVKRELRLEGPNKMIKEDK